MTTANPQALAEALIPPEEWQPSAIAEVPNLPSYLSKIRSAEAMQGTAFAETPFAIQDALCLRRLQQMVHTLRLNPLWAKRLDEAGVTSAPANFEEWQAIPLSDKEVMREFYMGERPGLVVPLRHGGFEIVASGGTSSGQPVETVYSLRELADTYELAGEFMGRYQLADFLDGDDPKWVMTTLADYQMWSSGTMVGGVLQRIPGINYIGAGPVRKDVFQHILSYPGPKAILGISAGIGILTELGMGLDEEARRSLRVALYGSGVLPQRKRSELKALYPNLNILSYFAATQAETIGLQMDPDSPILAAVPGLHLIEIVDADGRWVKEGEEGELVVTRLHAHEAPLPRFKIGDRMIRKADHDGPGLRAMQFEFSGRSGDMIHIGDTQFSAPQLRDLLNASLQGAGICQMEQVAHEIQFLNHRAAKFLGLTVAVDDPAALRAKLQYRLGVQGVRQIFVDALLRSLSLFNGGEANAAYIDRSGYRFDIVFVERGGPSIFRTEVGKTPLLRDML